MPRSFICLLCLPGLSLAADDLTVLTTQSAGGPPRQMLTRALKQQAHEALARRRAAYEKLKTPEQLTEYQQGLRRTFIEHLGGFPERTPLNARVVGAIEGERYRMEKIIFESQPRHFVTAVLYLPTTTAAPFPAVLMPCGHSPGGKVENQVHGIFLARSGFACLCYDPIGQGERHQFLSAQGKPRFGSTTEHTLLGAGSILVGRNTAMYRIWDGMRSLDYLVSRKDIDGKKIGVTGCSGGGTLTSYLMALDDRVSCAAPSCYITSFDRLLDTLGPQDAEQNIHGQIAFGMDHADYILMRAPKPTLMLCSTHDFFDIQGSWDTFRQAKRFYTRMGFAERINLVEIDAKHGYPKPQREAMVRWMSRWLAGKDEAITEPPSTPRPAADLLCMPRGQVMLVEGARSVVDLNTDLVKQLEPARRKLWEDRAKALSEVRRIAGIRPLTELPRAKVESIGILERSGYKIEKLTLEMEPGIRLPALLFRPEKASGKRCLYLHGQGKQAAPAGALEKRVQAGELVLAVDPRGVGETGPAKENIWGGDWQEFFVSYLLGKSLVGMRAEDVLNSARFLSEWESKDKPVRVDVVASGVAGPAALHAAALENQLFDTVTLHQSLRSWSDLVRHCDSAGQLVNVVHGALRAYDLPNLESVLPKEKLTVEDALELGKKP